MDLVYLEDGEEDAEEDDDAEEQGEGDGTAEEKVLKQLTDQLNSAQHLRHLTLVFFFNSSGQ